MSLSLVRTGTKYAPEYVDRLIAGVSRHLAISNVTLLSDQPEDFTRSRAAGAFGVTTINIASLNLPGWWAKMALLNPFMRGPGRALYIDLDTVVVGDLRPLVALTPPRFIIGASFARQFGNQSWPCRYGSWLMLFPEDWGMRFWLQFEARRAELMKLPCGDQQAIEALIPDADLFQSFLSPRFFLNYRELIDHLEGPPPGASLVAFGGANKPHTCRVPWVNRAWTRP